MALFIGLLLVVTYATSRSNARDRALSSARQQVTAAVGVIDAEFSAMMRIGEGLAADLESGDLAYADIDARMIDLMTRHPSLDGVAITFLPFAYNPDLRLYQSYVSRTAAGDLDILNGATYDYTERPNGSTTASVTTWFYNPIENGAVWNEPFFATGAQKILIEYGLPFNAVGEGTIAGVITIDQSIATMRDLMSRLELGATGYGYVIATNATFLAHPVAELVARTTIFETDAVDTALQDDARAALRGTARIYEGIDSMTGQAVWVFHEPLPSTGWVLGAVLNQAEFLPSARENAHDQVIIALVLMASVLFAFGLIVRLPIGRTRSLWAIAIGFATACTLLIAFVWATQRGLESIEQTPLTTLSIVARSIESYTAQLGSDTSPPILIPTGVLVQALDFPDPVSVNVNGYIWQRYPIDLDKAITRGFSLPRLIGEEAILEEVSRTVENGHEVILWYIGTRLRQSYRTDRFPFDQRDIELRIAPIELSANLVFVPDLEAYPLMTAATLPGVDLGVNLNNWQLLSSRFYHQHQHVNTTFGLETRIGRSLAPQLTFVITAQRDFVGPFIAYLIPGIVAAGMLFAFLLSDRRSEGDESIVSALNYSAAIFFVIAITHTALRDRIAAEGVTYLEYVYILLYVAIILIAVNTFTAVKYPRMAIVTWRDNLAIKLLYLPAILIVLLVATLITFIFS